MITYTHTQMLHLLSACGDDTLQAEMTRSLKGGGPTGGLEPVGLLHHAAALNRILAIEPMRRAHADMDIQDMEGWSPALRATACRNDDFVRELHRCGADLASNRLKDNSTLLHVASSFGRTGIIGSMVDLGLEVNAQNDRLRTPAHEACANLVVLQRLVQAGARLDVPDFEGNTVVHLAAMAYSSGSPGSPGVMGFLMDRNIDMDRPNLAGQSPMDLLMVHLSPGNDASNRVQSGFAARRAISEMSAELTEMLPRQASGARRAAPV